MQGFNVAAVDNDTSHTTPPVCVILQGFNVVVAENAFGCGSSREEAVRALVQSGVKAVSADVEVERDGCTGGPTSILTTFSGGAVAKGCSEFA